VLIPNKIVITIANPKNGLVETPYFTGIAQTVALFANSVWVFSIKIDVKFNNPTQKLALFFDEKYPMTIPA